MKYVVNCTNPDDLASSKSASSFGTGKYGFTVHASNMQDAKSQVINRAKKDGFWGYDWLADITRLNK